MNQKFKNLLKVGLLIVGVSLIVTNCQKDDLENNTQKNIQEKAQKFSVTVLRTKEVQNNKNLMRLINKAEKKVSENRTNKTVYNADYDFTINTSYAKVIETNGLKNYTFGVYRKEANGLLENLLLKEQVDSTFVVSLVQYDITTAEKNGLINQEIVDLEGKITFVALDDISDSIFNKLNADAETCTVFSYEWQQGSLCRAGGSHSYSQGDQCNAWGNPDLKATSGGYVLTTGEQECGSGGGVTMDSGPLYGEPSGSQSGGYGGGDSSTNPDTTPVLCPGCPVLEEDEHSEECIANIAGELGLTTEEITCLSSNVENAGNMCEMYNYLTDNQSNSNPSPQSIALVEEFLEIVCEEIPSAKFQRFVELKNILENNPWALIENCAEQNGLSVSNYQQLYDHTITQECITRLNNLGSGFSNQPIEDGNVATANIDYYSVEITAYPDFDGDGNPDLEEEIFNEFKSSFLDLVSGEKEDFQFSCEVPLNPTNTGQVSWEFLPYADYDFALWNSTQSPVTTIIGIEGASNNPLLNVSSDHGAIMVSEFTSNHLIGSTIRTPLTASQPFSGNRQWGWLINQSGNLEFFTRAVDVANVSNMIKVLSLGNNPCQEDTYYNIAEATWESLQEGLVEWITNNGGTATIVPKTAVRVEKQKIKELLESNETIDQILCQ